MPVDGAAAAVNKDFEFCFSILINITQHFNLKTHIPDSELPVAVAAQYVVVETVADIVAAVVHVLTQPKQFLLVKKSAAVAVAVVDVAEFLIRHGPNLTSVEN